MRWKTLILLAAVGCRGSPEPHRVLPAAVQPEVAPQPEPIQQHVAVTPPAPLPPPAAIRERAAPRKKHCKSRRRTGEFDSRCLPETARAKNNPIDPWE